MKHLLLALFTIAASWNLAAQQSVTIRFQAMVGEEELACGKSYKGVGVTKSTITPRDFRFYVHNLRLTDSTGKETPVDLTQDGKWQLDNVALLDFENATGSCSNGTPEMNKAVVGTVPAGSHFTGLRFTLGVPFEKNHTDLTKMPPPLNLTALAWVWNVGRKFARLDFSSTGAPRGWAIHLGSTNCKPDETKITVPTNCANPNRLEVELTSFDPDHDVVIADLASILRDSNVDEAGKMMSGCMSFSDTPACVPLFANLGLPYEGHEAGPQKFFRKSQAPAITAAANKSEGRQ